MIIAAGVWACGTEEGAQNAEGVAEGGYTCQQCHTNKDLLKASLAADPTDHKPMAEGGCGGSISRAEGTDPIFVEPSFLDTVHGRMGCQVCHGGVMPAKDRRKAHAGNFHVDVDPEKICSQCHEDITKNFLNNIHTKLNGLKPTDKEFIKRATVHEMRVSDDEESKEILAEGLEQGGCAECHRATCGSCHVTLPESAGGGFPGTGHMFSKQPSDVYNCTACHGSRKGAEYMLSGYSVDRVRHSDVVTGLGLKDYKVQRDIHYNKGMACTDCHNENWMHGAGPDIAGSLRYNDPKLPTCQDCHVKGQENKFYTQKMHMLHAKPNGPAPYLQCEVCHAQVYPNCLSCHVTPKSNGTEPPPDYKFYTLKIAKNPLKLDWYKNHFPFMGERRPYDYSLVRRAAVVPDTFDAYRPNGPTVMGHYTDYPTWKYATPHTIALVTPQTKDGCRGCHEGYDGGRLDANKKVLFLTTDFLTDLFINGLGKVKPGPGATKAASYLKKELEANAPILMDDFFKPVGDK